MEPKLINSQNPSALVVPLQPTSLATWNTKYRLRGRDGQPVDRGIEDTQLRVAEALAAVEATPELQRHWRERFLWALAHGAIPAGRIMANVGASAHKPATSTINCTVSGTIQDSMDDILTKLHEAGLTLKSGAGIGYEFSTLRPKGAFVAGAGAQTSGPLSFMDIFDRMCFTIASAGGRRGAQMATFDVSHPDVLAAIGAKREAGRLRQFNLSLLITREFMEAVKDDQSWPLVFPLSQAEQTELNLTLSDPESVQWRRWPIAEGYITDNLGRVACRVHQRVPARLVWDAIMRSTYEFAEPGFILIDAYNSLNNNWFCEDLRATNPCGEQGLPPYGACLLGSINLTAFVRDAFGSSVRFEWDEFREVVTVFTRMLDNVVEVNGLPLARQRAELRCKRRHGMGFLGLGSALAMLKIPYGSSAAIKFTGDVSRELALCGWHAALALAEEKGPAPIMEELFTLTPRHFEDRPELARDGYQVGDQVPGRILHARYSRYLQQLAGVAPALIERLAAVGARFTHHSSIAPTGTIALSFGNNVSNGIEPSFAHHYIRNVIEVGRKTKEAVDVWAFEVLAYREFLRSKGLTADEAAHTALPDYFVTTDDITPRQHVDMQAAAQTWIDSSISKTINCPSDISYDAFKDIYRYAYEQGLKGCTTFRFNPSAFQGVLVKTTDRAQTRYRFTLADGSTVEATGDEAVDYEGEQHTAANLHDALKEGYYGTF
ncbi:MAG: adenosylcobalamin-dependent ribonucleoside-diphosphate reductase [Gammaproteobacteria bacterium]|nr:adenosylcobalamin-dependent ribonucleoside-diphosphate reductase [Gammaproteobacteria bacterium]